MFSVRINKFIKENLNEESEMGLATLDILIYYKYII